MFVRCIVTSRVTLIDKASIPKNSQILRLCDFNDVRVQAWCDIWNERNEQHFAKHSLKKFEVAPGGKIKELVRQPLLLLMLALYEMNGGHLQEQDDISRAKLYYQLILDFVIRECKKDSEYNHKERKAQEKAVENDFLQLSIAALGMYNRKKLFIQSGELGADLAFLTQEKTAADNIDERALPKSDQLIGSFFFIHTSSAPTGGGAAKVSAYEFLHNTFGEFLTAYYILHMTFQMIKRQQLDDANDEAFSWAKALQKKWYAGLAYAPLFTRPVVLNMIHELSDVFLQKSGLDAEKVQDALDTRFHEELRDIISGETFGTLREVLNVRENPYRHSELMVHAAVYSVNLILLRATVCGDGFTFTEGLGSTGDWQKLTHIWRYAFSEEELVSLSCLIELRHSGSAYALTYMYDEEAANRAGALSKLDRLLYVSDVLGDDAAFAVFNSVRGAITPEIDEILTKEHLQLRTRYALNELIECLATFDLNRRAHDDLFRAMEKLGRCCMDELDVIGLLVYYMLLQMLAEQGVLDSQDMSQLLDRDSFMYVAEPLHFSSRFLLYNFFFKELLVCAKYLPNAAQWSFMEEFFDHFRRCDHYSRRPPDSIAVDDTTPLIILEALISVLENCQNHLPEGLCFEFFAMLGLCGLWRLTPQVAQICRLLYRIGYRDESDRILDFFLHDTGSKDTTRRLIQDMNRSPALMGAFIDCCYYAQRTHSFGRKEHAEFYRFEKLYQ